MDNALPSQKSLRGKDTQKAEALARCDRQNTSNLTPSAEALRRCYDVILRAGEKYSQQDRREPGGTQPNPVVAEGDKQYDGKPSQQ
jgi:hypothetical protein